MTEAIENRTFAEIELGDSATLTRILSAEDIHLLPLPRVTLTRRISTANT